jgi:hypothetical protein
MCQALQIGLLQTMQLPHQLPWSSCLAARTLCHCKACWQQGSCSSQVQQLLVSRWQQTQGSQLQKVLPTYLLLLVLVLLQQQQDREQPT